MKFKTTSSRGQKVNYIPAKSSRKGGRTACLCWDTNTYSIECCDGSLHAQGIGNIYRTS
jgi:hypothetical protein